MAKNTTFKEKTLEVPSFENNDFNLHHPSALSLCRCCSVADSTSDAEDHLRRPAFLAPPSKAHRFRRLENQKSQKRIKDSKEKRILRIDRHWQMLNQNLIPVKGPLTIMAQSSSSFTSRDGIEGTPFFTPGSVSNRVDYTSDRSNFVPLTPTTSSMAIPTELASAIPLIDRFQVEGFRASGEAILRTLPCRCCVFFSVRKLEYTIDLLPRQIVLGIDKIGVHFFSPMPKNHILSVKLEDIKIFGYKDTAVAFQMQASGGLHEFKFVTKQGKEICEALQLHIEESQKNTYQGSEFKAVLDEKLKQEQLQRLQKDVLQCLSVRDRYKLLCEEKDDALLASQMEVEIMELNMAMLSLSLESKQNMAGKINEIKDVLQQRKALKLQVFDLEKKLAVSESSLARSNAEFATLCDNLKELEELRVMKEDVERKEAILKMREIELAELETLYKNEQRLRKCYYNIIEGMNGSNS
ncbi:hypothetical protein PTKIN_Ptkin18bG0154700 [Pterospermum kingtungense]